MERLCRNCCRCAWTLLAKELTSELLPGAASRPSTNEWARRGAATLIGLRSALLGAVDMTLTTFQHEWETTNVTSNEHELVDKIQSPIKAKGEKHIRLPHEQLCFPIHKIFYNVLLKQLFDKDRCVISALLSYWCLYIFYVVCRIVYVLYYVMHQQCC
jgi:hypothetical protein